MPSTIRERLDNQWDQNADLVNWLGLEQIIRDIIKDAIKDKAITSELKLIDEALGAYTGRGTQITDQRIKDCEGFESDPYACTPPITANDLISLMQLRQKFRTSQQEFFGNSTLRSDHFHSIFFFKGALKELEYLLGRCTAHNAGIRDIRGA